MHYFILDLLSTLPRRQHFFDAAQLIFARRSCRIVLCLSLLSIVFAPTLLYIIFVFTPLANNVSTLAYQEILSTIFSVGCFVNVLDLLRLNELGDR